ncbi:MAG: hypothetical protein ACI9XZ_003559, partial [Alphaproteobacteria bacterium]
SNLPHRQSLHQALLHCPKISETKAHEAWLRQS